MTEDRPSSNFNAGRALNNDDEEYKKDSTLKHGDVVSECVPTSLLPMHRVGRGKKDTQDDCRVAQSFRGPSLGPSGVAAGSVGICVWSD
jgi:hypothetical protein